MKVIAGTAKVMLIFVGGAVAFAVANYAVIGLGMVANELEAHPEDGWSEATQKAINGWNYLLA